MVKKQGETEDLDEKSESIKELIDSDYIDVLSNSEKNNEKSNATKKVKLDVPNVSLPKSAVVA